jgi:predicted CxxxxCH...CXXCH cytochrome family protein
MMISTANTPVTTEANMTKLKPNQKRSEDMRDTMNPGQMSTMQTRTAALRRRFSMIGLLAMTLFLCLVSSAWAAEMVTNGGFNTVTSWGLTGSNPPTYTAAQSNNVIAGAGSIEEKIIDQAGVTYTGVLQQSVTMYAGAVITDKNTDIDFYAKHLTTSDTSTSSVKISLRYSDASTVEIFNGTVSQGSGWTNSITNTTATVFPLTITQDVNTLIVELNTSTNTLGDAELYFDDFTIAYTPSVSTSLSVPRKVAVSTTAEPGETGVQMEFLQINSNTVDDGIVVVTSATVLFSALDAADLPLVTTGLYDSVTVAIDDDKIYNNGTLGEVTQAWESDDEVVVDLTPLPVGVRTVAAGIPNTRYLWILYNLLDAGTDYRVISDVSAIGVLAPDFSPVKGSSDWSSNEVYVTVGLACMGCHPTPPTDATVRERATGATKGSHGWHGVTQGLDCDVCHLAKPTIPNHRNNLVEMNTVLDGYAGARYDKDGDHVADASFVQSPTPVLGRCENTSCHGGDNNVTAGYGGPTGIGPQWGDRAKDLCTFCHNADNANTNGEPNDGRDKSYPSSDVSASPFRTLDAASAHRVHMETELAVVVCDDCHIVPATTNDVGHLTDRDDPAEVIAAPGYDPGTMVCSTTYCHGDAMPQSDTSGTTKTPTWNVNDWPNYPVGCTASCHGLPPTSGLSAISHGIVENMTLNQCQNCHVDTVLSALSPPNLDLDPAFHINGFVEATSDCGGCHGGANVAPSTGKHDKHLAFMSSPAFGSLAIGDPAGEVADWDATNYPLCAVCHDMSDEASYHKDAADYIMGSTKKAARAFSAAGDPTYDALGTFTCSNVNCHVQETTPWK